MNVRDVEPTEDLDEVFGSPVKINARRSPIKASTAVKAFKTKAQRISREEECPADREGQAEGDRKYESQDDQSWLTRTISSAFWSAVRHFWLGGEAGGVSRSLFRLLCRLISQ